MSVTVLSIPPSKCLDQTPAMQWQQLLQCQQVKDSLQNMRTFHLKPWATVSASVPTFALRYKNVLGNKILMAFFLQTLFFVSQTYRSTSTIGSKLSMSYHNCWRGCQPYICSFVASLARDCTYPSKGTIWRVWSSPNHDICMILIT